MTAYEEAYLALVIAAFLFFGMTLGAVSWVNRH